MYLQTSQFYRFLLTFSIFCVILLFIRMFVAANLFYGFLIWNLFLAAIPFMISSWLLRTRWIRKRTFPLLLFLGIWLLFLPNAPYIITDLMHLRQAKSSMSWLDPFLVFSFALNGLLYGIFSLQHVFQLLSDQWNRKTATIILFMVVFLCGFGIYLGRFLRWNSWELFSNPMHLATDCLYSLFHPDYRVRTWGITLGFGSFLWLLFSAFQQVFYIKKDKLS